jgi:hypothetical protein
LRALRQQIVESHHEVVAEHHEASHRKKGALEVVGELASIL